jgi:hypothetical protein
MTVKYNGDVIPCVEYRMGQQYAVGGDARPLGNLFASGVAGVWNGPAFRAMRRAAADPARFRTDPGLCGHFCEGCPALFRTNARALARRADAYACPEPPAAKPAPPVRRPRRRARRPVREVAGVA